MTVQIKILRRLAGLAVVKDSQRCSVENDKRVRWSSKDYKDWRVIFAPDAPLYPKVASPRKPKLTLKAKRPEDLRHVKYVVVAWSDKGLVHKDPELIVDR